MKLDAMNELKDAPAVFFDKALGELVEAEMVKALSLLPAVEIVEQEKPKKKRG